VPDFSNQDDDGKERQQQHCQVVCQADPGGENHQARPGIGGMFPAQVQHGSHGSREQHQPGGKRGAPPGDVIGGHLHHKRHQQGSQGGALPVLPGGNRQPEDRQRNQRVNRLTEVQHGIRRGSAGQRTVDGSY